MVEQKNAFDFILLPDIPVAAIFRNLKSSSSSKPISQTEPEILQHESFGKRQNHSGLACQHCRYLKRMKVKS